MISYSINNQLFHIILFNWKCVMRTPLQKIARMSLLQPDSWTLNTSQIHRLLHILSFDKTLRLKKKNRYYLNFTGVKTDAETQSYLIRLKRKVTAFCLEPQCPNSYSSLSYHTVVYFALRHSSFSVHFKKQQCRHKKCLHEELSTLLYAQRH